MKLQNKILVILFLFFTNTVLGSCDTLKIQNYIYSNLFYLSISYKSVVFLDNKFHNFNKSDIIKLDTVVREPSIDLETGIIKNADVFIFTSHLSSLTQICICILKKQDVLVTLYYSENGIEYQSVNQKILGYLLFTKPRKGFKHAIIGQVSNILN